MLQAILKCESPPHDAIESGMLKRISRDMLCLVREMSESERTRFKYSTENRYPKLLELKSHEHSSKMEKLDTIYALLDGATFGIEWG